MPKKSKEPNDKSQESTLGPLAKALDNIDANEPAEGAVARQPPEGEAEPAPEGEPEKTEGSPETPQEC